MITTVNLPDELHALLKQVADQERRSMNATILMAVEQYVADLAARARQSVKVILGAVQVSGTASSRICNRC